MIGISSVISLEDKFSGTIGLLTKGIRGTLSPMDLLNKKSMSAMGTLVPFAARTLPSLYTGFESMKGALNLASFSLAGLVEKASNAEGMLMKVGRVFPFLQPFVGLFSDILSRVRDGDSVFRVAVDALAELNLPFTGLIKTFLRIKEFMSGAGGKIIKLALTIAKLTLAIKLLWFIMGKVEHGAPKVFEKIKSGMQSMTGLLDGGFAKYKTMALESFKRVNAVLQNNAVFIKARENIQQFTLKGAYQYGKLKEAAKENLGKISAIFNKSNNSLNVSKSSLSGYVTSAKALYGRLAMHAKMQFYYIASTIQMSPAYAKAKEKLGYFMLYSWSTYHKIKDNAQSAFAKVSSFVVNSKAYANAREQLTRFVTFSKDTYSKYSDIVKTNLLKIATMVQGSSAYQKGIEKVHLFRNLVLSKYDSLRTGAVAAFDKIKTAITNSKAYNVAREHFSRFVAASKSSLGKYVASAKGLYENLALHVKARAYYIAGAIQMSPAYAKAKEKLGYFMLYAWSTYNKIKDKASEAFNKIRTTITGSKLYSVAREKLQQFTLKGAYQYGRLSEAARESFGKIKKYIMESAAFNFAKKHLTALRAQMQLNGPVEGIKNYIAYVKESGKPFEKLKAVGMRAFDGLKKQFFILRAQMQMNGILGGIKNYFLLLGKGTWFNTAVAGMEKYIDKLKQTVVWQKISAGIDIFKGYFASVRQMVTDSSVYKAVVAHAALAWGKVKTLGIAAWAGVKRQASILVAMIKLHGFTDGISNYIAYTKLLGIEFIKTKLLALKSFLAMKISAIWAFIQSKIASNRFFQGAIKGFISLYRAAKDWFGRLPAIVKAAFSAYMIYRFVKGIKSAFDSLSNTLDSWKEKVDELIEKTNNMEKAARRAMQMGPEMASKFTRMATRMSIETGIAKNDILDFNMALSRIGVGNETNKALTDLAARFSTLNENMDFNSVSNALVDAIKQGSADGLAELMHGNPLARVKFQRMHLDRMLSKGDVQGFLKSFSAIADQFGYTQEKADELQNTTQGKLKRIGTNIDRLSERIKNVYISKVEPYIDKFLDFIQSSEFQAQFEQITSQFGALLTMVGGFVEKLVDVGLAIYKWWIEPTGGALREVLIFIGAAGMITKIIRIFMGFKFIGPLLASTFSLGKRGVYGLYRAISEATDGYKRFKDGGVPAVFDSNIRKMQRAVSSFGRSCLTVAKTAGKALGSIAISPGMAFAGAAVFIGRGAKKLNEELTGESKGTLESIVDVVVGGTHFAGLQLQRNLREVCNDIIGHWENLGISFKEWLQDLINGMIESYYGMVNKINQLKYKVTGLEMFNVKYTPDKFELPKSEFKRFHIMTDDEMVKDTDKLLAQVKENLPWMEKAGNTALELMGLKDPEDYMRDWEQTMKQLESGLDDTNGTLKGIKRNTDSMRQRMDLQWMKELAEQRFVNNVNIRQMVPTVNVKVSGSKITPQDTADALARELNQMADAGAFNAYGGKV